MESNNPTVSKKHLWIGRALSAGPLLLLFVSAAMTLSRRQWLLSIAAPLGRSERGPHFRYVHRRA